MEPSIPVRTLEGFDVYPYELPATEMNVSGNFYDNTRLLTNTSQTANAYKLKTVQTAAEGQNRGAMLSFSAQEWNCMPKDEKMRHVKTSVAVLIHSQRSEAHLAIDKDVSEEKRLDNLRNVVQQYLTLHTPVQYHGTLPFLLCLWTR